MEYEIRVEGLADFDVRLRAINKEYRDQIISAVEKASQEAGAYMASHVPQHSGKLFRAINVEPVRYHPGGAGGGGFYEANVGVDETQAPHAIFVIEGTGIYHREGSRGNIRPASGNVMAFVDAGKEVFAAYTKGQEPQSAWFEVAQEVADAVIRRET
jgi:hypothetical protein